MTMNSTMHIMTHFLQKKYFCISGHCEKLAVSPTDLANTSFKTCFSIWPIGTNDLFPQKRTSTAPQP